MWQRGGVVGASAERTASAALLCAQAVTPEGKVSAPHRADVPLASVDGLLALPLGSSVTVSKQHNLSEPWCVFIPKGKS